MEHVCWQFHDLFYIITIIALVALAFFYRACEPEDRWNRIGLVLMMAGAVGNLIDRAIFQYVRDFYHSIY